MHWHWYMRFKNHSAYPKINSVKFTFTFFSIMIFYSKPVFSTGPPLTLFQSNRDECEVSTRFNHVDFSQLFDRLLLVRFE